MALQPGAEERRLRLGLGSNAIGQLGDGTINNQRNTPVEVSDLSDVQAIAAGLVHSLALKNDGSVWAWGRNAEGQLGDGTNDFFRSTPVPVSALSDVQDIAAGESYSLALKNDGSVWAWGLNGNGQLGDDTNIDSNTPVQVSGLSDVQAIAAGGHHSLALKNDGSVWVWGFPENSTTPVQMSGLSGCVAIPAAMACTPSPCGRVYGAPDQGRVQEKRLEELRESRRKPDVQEPR